MNCFPLSGDFVFDRSKLFKMDAAPSAKRSKLDNGAGDAYIPTQEHTDGEPTFAVIFSLHEEKGALARALKPFEVRSVNQDGCVQFINSSRWPYYNIILLLMSHAQGWGRKALVKFYGTRQLLSLFPNNCASG